MLVFKTFDPNEPRDEQGRWTDGGGSDSSGGDGKPAGKPKEPKQLQEIIEAVPGAAAKIAEVRAKLAQSVRTDAHVTEGGHVRSDGSYAPERQKVHAAILEKYFSPENVAAATPAKGEKPVLHLLGGAGGSGKSWYTGPNGTIDKSKALYLNSDDIKAMLPEYKGWNAALLHEEASHVQKLVESVAKSQGLNLIIDGTMGKLESLQKRVKDYKAGGYQVEGHFMRVEPEVAAHRALSRFVRGGETGRFVPPELLLAHSATQNFEIAATDMHKWEMYDNNTEGEQPRFVKRG